MDSRRSIVLLAARICVTHDFRSCARFLDECESIERIDKSFVIVFVPRDDREVRRMRSDPFILGGRKVNRLQTATRAAFADERQRPWRFGCADVPDDRFVACPEGDLVPGSSFFVVLHWKMPVPRVPSRPAIDQHLRCDIVTAYSALV